MKNLINDFLQFWTDHSAKIIAAFIVLIVGIILIKLLLRIINASFQKSKVSPTIQKFSLSILRVVCYILLITTLLQVFGVPMTSIIAAFSVVGLAVSLAIQNSLANVAGGVTLLFSKPFVVGDYIQYDNLEGTVLQISILTTKIATLDNKFVFIPNSKLTEDSVTNFTYSDNRRIDLEIGIGYQDDFKHALKVIEDIVADDPLIITSHEKTDFLPFIRMFELGESSVVLTVRVWTETNNYLTAKCGLLEKIKEKFDSEGINIPYPQMEISIKKES